MLSDFIVGLAATGCTASATPAGRGRGRAGLGEKISREDHAANGFSGFRVMSECGIVDGLLDLEALWGLGFGDGFVNVGGHSWCVGLVM